MGVGCCQAGFIIYIHTFVRPYTRSHTHRNIDKPRPHQTHRNTRKTTQGHIHFASLPGMWDRTLTVSSAGKTFSVTGWQVRYVCEWMCVWMYVRVLETNTHTYINKINPPTTQQNHQTNNQQVGWVVGPRAMVADIQVALPYVQFCASTPMQARVYVHTLSSISRTCVLIHCVFHRFGRGVACLVDRFFAWDVSHGVASEWPGPPLRPVLRLHAHAGASLVGRFIWLMHIY